MSRILNIETSTHCCSVSISENGNCIAHKEVIDEKYSHSEKLTVFIEALFSENQLKLSDIDAVAVGKGPGSYTGLRIGVATAKGICYALDKPFIAINSLAILAHHVKQPSDDLLIIPMIDARRMEVYASVLDSNFTEIISTKAVELDGNSFSQQIKSGKKIVMLGDGAEKAKPIFKDNSNVIFLENKYPSAQNMCQISEAKFQEKQFEDVAYFEPFYLKDFVAIKAKKVF